jgi:cytochrome c peroxidase
MVRPVSSSMGQRRRVRAWRALAAGALALIAGCSTLEQVVETSASLDARSAALSPEQAEQKTRAAARPTDHATLRGKYRRPADLPAGAHASAAIVGLGEKLFKTTELSAGRKIACVSCHLPNAAWADLKAKPIADNGRPMSRRSQTLYDIAWANAFLWDGRQETLEAMVNGPIASPDIMGLSLDAMVQRLAFSDEFAADFRRVYPDIGPTPETVSDALAAFMRTIRSPATRFDRWVKGDDKALSVAELRGFKLFNGKANCVACHSGWRFTDEGFRDIGLPDTSDRGRGRVKPQIESLAFAFKTPTLRGVAERAPYMHDGSLRTLEAVIEHYDRGGVRRPSLSPDMFPLGLSAQEKSDLVAFMRSLSGQATGTLAQSSADPETRVP